MDTKTALLDAAEEAVRTHGFDGFSYADLAAVVGIRKASIHHHFPTKADLALGLIERYEGDFAAALANISESRATGGARLEQFVAAYRGALRGGTRLCLCVAYCVSRDALSPAVVARLDAFHVATARWLAEVFALGQADGTIADVQDPQAEAEACLAQVEGAQLIARGAGDDSRFDAAVANLTRRVTAG